MPVHKKTIVAIVGPTAVGKTAVAVQLAQQLGTSIISADSRQCYRELVIGVARPSDEELAVVPHHFIASHSIQEKVTAAVFEQYALETMEQLFRDQDLVVVVGGTGLYLKALYEGMDLIPEVPESVHEQVVEFYRVKGISWLQEELEKKDPLFAASGEMKNPQRMMRALEVMMASGRSIREFQKGAKEKRGFNILQVGLTLPKELLHRNIEYRVQQMMQQGLEDEVRSLESFRHLNALQTVGYKEIFEYLDGNCTLTEAVSAIVHNTKQYAKRQMTWFKKDASINWMAPAAVPEINKLVQQQSTGGIR